MTNNHTVNAISCASIFQCSNLHACNSNPFVPLNHLPKVSFTEKKLRKTVRKRLVLGNSKSAGRTKQEDK